MIPNITGLTPYSSDKIKNKISSQRVSYCSNGKIYYFYQSRNVWYWGLNKSCLGYSSFSLTFEEAKRKIEKYRTQGSTWYIEQLPVCIFSSEKYSLVVAEIKTKSPLKDFANKWFKYKTIRKIAKIFEPSKSDSLKCFICSANIIDQLYSPLKRYKSESCGGRDYLLGWSKIKESDYQATHINKIVQQFNSR